VKRWIAALMGWPVAAVLWLLWRSDAAAYGLMVDVANVWRDGALEWLRHHHEEHPGCEWERPV
jgi:hypothetical protein